MCLDYIFHNIALQTKIVSFVCIFDIVYFPTAAFLNSLAIMQTFKKKPTKQFFRQNSHTIQIR